MGKRWTDKEDGILETLRDGGMTFEEIASVMGRTKQAVQQRASVLKRNEPTFREVVDTAFAKHGIEFGEPDEAVTTIDFGDSDDDAVTITNSGNANGIKENMRDLSKIINQMERDIKPKPQWWKAMMWWRK
jgi:glycine cleavage system pyridoxal-binding protein P